jgi:aspartyl-tRNA(Asn)/glutamyl-tRNA(Gln) amidotransferase subunit A
LCWLTATQAREKLKAKEITLLELTEAIYQQIKSKDNLIKAYLYLNEEEALKQAKKLLSTNSGNQALSLPIAIKDNICIEGMPTTCASKILGNYLPVYDAHVIEKLKANSAIFLGKTNMDEFAMGSSTENSAFQITANPWDTSRVPGGSSGGSAAAVAAGEALWALGSDTGGSIRQPASFCGIVGLKPTYGLVSRYGLVAFASSLDQIGPLCRSVSDAALLLEIISGWDQRDSTSVKYNPPVYSQNLGKDIKGIKIGLPKELFVSGIDSDVKEQINLALSALEDLGAKIEEVSLPTIKYALPAYYLIAPAEASSNLARFDGVRYGYRAKETTNALQMYKLSRSHGFGAEVKRRIMLGTYALSAGYYSAYYGKAQRARTLIINEFRTAFSKYDLLISPTSPTTAFKIGEKVDDPLQMYLSDICTIPVNLAGVPAISLPCGLSNGLPVGLQIIGNYFEEQTLLKVGYALEQEINFRARPPLF